MGRRPIARSCPVVSQGQTRRVRSRHNPPPPKTEAAVLCMYACTRYCMLCTSLHRMPYTYHVAAARTTTELSARAPPPLPLSPPRRTMISAHPSRSPDASVERSSDDDQKKNTQNSLFFFVFFFCSATCSPFPLAPAPGPYHPPPPALHFILRFQYCERGREKDRKTEKGKTWPESEFTSVPGLPTRPSITSHASNRITQKAALARVAGGGGGLFEGGV